MTALREALATALHAASWNCRYDNYPGPGGSEAGKACEEYNPGGHAKHADAILATEAMQPIADLAGALERMTASRDVYAATVSELRRALMEEQARSVAAVALAEAIERLPDSDTWWIERAPDGSLDADRGRAFGVRIGGDRRWFYAATLPAAIDAALASRDPEAKEKP